MRIFVPKLAQALLRSKKLFKNLNTIFFIFISQLIFPQASYADYASSFKWNTIETPHFLIHYHTGLQLPANEIADQAEDVHQEITAYFNWVPKEKTHIVVSDQSESPNGFASVFPNNRIELLMAPPSEVSGLEDYKDWKRLVLRHEYVHIVHLDKAEDYFLHARSFVGRYWLFFPNTFLPRWITEGIATFIETEEKINIGRGQSSYFRGLMRNEVINGLKSLNQVNQYRTEWPAGTGFYLYGVYFFNFIRDKYGEEKIKQFVSDYSYFPIPFFINTVSKQTFNKDMFDLWVEFESYLNAEFKDEIQTLKLQQAETTPATSLSSTGFFSGFTRLSGNKLYYIRSDRENVKELVEQNLTTKQIRVVSELRDQDSVFPHSFDIHRKKGILIPILEYYENSRQSFDLYKIYPETGGRVQLTKDKRYIRAIWSPDGRYILALGNRNGIHNLDILTSTGKLIKTIWQGKSGFAINSFDWSSVKDEVVVS
ncbi:MAG: hypothetical protein OEX07_14615, partial [Gammaproteobacteria bacterium]|nr:hypothetical protein [Gammaproteobacteria bacterium]